MGLQNTAHYLKSKGRNGDTELVHMSPREVNGLQALARANGTSLTMNPNTGLPEAFRLEQLLPMAAGAALTIGSGGALSPLAASLLVGGGYGAATGSIEKGLMAGIGAYGGAGIATGVTGAASQGAIETSATNALGVPAGTPAPAPISPEFTPTDPFLDSVPVTSATPVTPSPSQASTLAAQNASMGLNPMQSAANISSSAGYAPGATPMPMSSQAVNLGSSGIENIFTKEGATAAYKGMPTGTLPATASTLLMAGQQQPNVPGYQEDAYDRRLKGYKLSPNYQPYQAPTPNPYYRPTYAADGGVMNSFDDSSGMDEPAGLAQGNLQKGLFGLGYADGGLSLGGYSDGGRMLKGPGDGMSDSIPGVIGGKQPARLADGEFVVPADVVSHLGNGSTDAGAKKLYSMMDKIRQARTGKKKQAPQVNVDKYLPMGKASGGITGYAEGGVIGYANGGTTYSDQQVLNAIKESMAQGFSLEESKEGAKRLGVTDSQLYKAAALLQPTPINTPVTTTQTPQTYSDQRILDAIKESLAQGVGLEDTKNALRTRYGVDDAQLYRVADLYNKPTTTTQTPVAPPVIPKTTYSDQQVLDAILASMKEGFTLEQSKQGARDKYGVTDAQLYKVSDLYNNSLAAQNTYKEIAAKQAAAQQTAAANEAASKSIAAYRPSFVPRVSGISMSPTMQDPYSDIGLKSLYEQMMGQYKAPTQPMSDTDIRTFAQNFARDNPGKGAELGQALINKGIPVNQAIAATGLSPGTLNTAYIGGQGLGTAAPPTLNTQYNYIDPGSYYRPAPVNNLVLQNPIPDAVIATADQAKADTATAATAKATADAGGATGRAGGLMSIDRKKRAKPKYKK